MFSFVASVVIVLNVMEREFLFFKLGKSCFKTTESAMGLDCPIWNQTTFKVV